MQVLYAAKQVTAQPLPSTLTLVGLSAAVAGTKSAPRTLHPKPAPARPRPPQSTSYPLGTLPPPLPPKVKQGVQLGGLLLAVC